MFWKKAFFKYWTWSSVAVAALAAAFLESCSSDSDSSSPEEILSSSSDFLESPASSSEEILIPENPELPFVGGPVIFTEVDPINTVYEDHEGGDGAWIELFNTSSEPVNLKGVSLTDSKVEPQKWIFGDAVIAPASFMVVYLSGKNLPDYVAPHDSANLIGPGCWSWTDSQNEENPGESYSEPLEGQSKLCFKENGVRRFGARMQLGENADLGWSSISSFIGTGSSDPDDVLDLSATNEILMHAYITKDRKVSFRLVQTGIDDWKGYELVFTGTGDSSTVYHATLPAGKTFPDLSIIYGTRMSPESQEKKEVTVKAFSYIARNRGHEPHANFKIKNKPGKLYLINADKEILDSVAYPDVSVGKTWSLGSSTQAENAGGLVWGYADPSPNGYTETTVIEERSPAVDTLSVLPTSGFYQTPFAIAFNESDFVRCEFDGTAPSENSPLVTAFAVDTTKVVRCASFMPGRLPGETVNRTYVFEPAPKVPAVFITANPGSMFNPDSGIYMEGPDAELKEPHYGANYWLDKEVPVFVELHEVGGTGPAFAKNAGLKIFGNYSRQNKKKSVSITFREKYGDKRLKYPLFPEFPELKEFKVFILRNNGSNFNNDYIRDRLASSITEGLGVDYQRGRGAIVYYNGEYFGIHNIRERSTEYYFETHYGYDPDEIDLLKADNSASAGSSVDYTAMIDYVKSHDMANDENFAYVAERIDIDNYLNYMQSEIFADNRDWPSNNLKKWRCNNPQTKWKWFIYDTDFGFGSEHSQFDYNVFEFVTTEDGEDWPNGPEHTFLLRNLLKNQGFKWAFINRMTTLLTMNFEPTRIQNRINALMAEIESEIPRDQKRWKLSSSWMNTQLKKIESFAKDRPQVIVSELKTFFGLGKVIPVTLSAKGPGRILVHNLPLDTSSKTVQFFEGTPVLLTALPDAGGIWSGWSDGDMSQTRWIFPEEISEIAAQFR